MIDWRHWHNEPVLIGGLIILGWLFALCAGPLRNRLAPAGTPYPLGHAIRFYSALVLFYLAVGSPLDQIGERFLFSAHMLQHQLLAYPTAVLFLTGLPHWMIDRLLGTRPRTFYKIIFHPIITALIFTLVISLWHVPMFYEGALQNKLIHLLEHIMMFGASLFFWWPIISPSRTYRFISYPSQMLYLLATTISMTPVFAYITFSKDVLYPTYEFAPRLFNTWTAVNDQLLAGVMMELVGVAVSIITFIASFYRWYQESKRNDRA